MAAYGITPTTDAWGDATGWRACDDACRAGRLSLRVSFMPGVKSSVYSAMKDAVLHSGFGDAMLRVLAGWSGRNPRFRIEHCSLVTASLSPIVSRRAVRGERPR